MGNKAPVLPPFLEGVDSLRELEENKVTLLTDVANTEKGAQLGVDLGKFVRSERFADVYFVVGPKRVRVAAHRVVIASRSAAFNRAMEERERQLAQLPEEERRRAQLAPLVIEVPDVALRVFDAILGFCYRDHISLNPALAPEIMAAARKFEINALVATCASFLSAGVNLETALAYYDLEHKTAQGFVEVNASTLFEQPQFEKLSKESLVSLVSSDRLAIVEPALFEAVVRWGEEQARRRHGVPSPAALREALNDVLPHIRFPLFSLQEFTSMVVPRDILTSEELVSVYQTLAGDEKARQAFPCRFPSVARANPKISFRFDPAHSHPALIFSLGNTTLSCAEGGGWRVAMFEAKGECSEGVLDVKFEVMEIDTAGHEAGIVVGFMPMNVFNQAAEQGAARLQNMLGAGEGWGLALGSGKCHVQNNVNGIVRNWRFGKGEVLGLRLTYPINQRNQNGVVTVFRAGNQLGAGWHGMGGPVVPAVAIFGKQTIRVLESKYTPHR